MQLSANSVSILNEIGFKDLDVDNKFNPKKVDFYSLKNNNKICDLDMTQFNYNSASYTTLKRSLLIEFLKKKLFTNSVQFNKKVEKINYFNSRIEITLENNSIDIFDYLIISDGVFSSTKSILFGNEIKPKYSGSLAIRALMIKKDIKFLNENNISLLLGFNIHLVTYAINTKNEFNLVAIIRKNLNKKDLNSDHFFNNKDNITSLIKNSSIQKNDELKYLFDNVKDIKWFPIFISDKIRRPDQKNTFFLGDALYASLPTFAQGASQSIEAAYELYNILNEDNEISFDQYFIGRAKRAIMIDRRSKLNHFIFHISNPILVAIRNIVLKIIVNNKIFLNKYLGKIYLKK